MTQFARQLDSSSERVLVVILALSGIARSSVGMQTTRLVMESAQGNHRRTTPLALRLSAQLISLILPRAGFLVRRPYRSRY
jgi:hypothetical protein